jgi:hypothetical protein
MLIFGLGAITVSVGNIAGNTSYFPIHTGYSYNYTQQIYTQPQINRSGHISKLRFYHHSSHPGSMESGHEWVIYLGHTGRSSFGSTADWEPTANLVQVFSGSILGNFPPREEWLEVVLDTPFNYDNVNNLVVAIHGTTPGLNYSTYWGCFSSGSNTGLNLHHNSINPDINNLPNARLMTDNIASIQLVFPDTEVPLPPTLLHPPNHAQVLDGDVLKWNLPPGSADVSNYDVYLDGVLVSENQASNRYMLSNLTPGHHTWQVVAKNNLGSSLPSETRIFTAPLAIGHDDFDRDLPISPRFYYSQSQSIFMQYQIGIAYQGAQQIEKIAYYMHGITETENSGEWLIYMCHTDRTRFFHDTDWTPASEMEQVFAGYVDFPATSGWVEIELDTPFVYNNTDNLLIAVYEMGDGYDAGCSHFHSTITPGLSRSLHYASQGSTLDPDSSPVGNLVFAHPNILMWFNQLPATPVLSVSPSALDFGTVMNGASIGPLTVSITNLGAGALNLDYNSISIIGPNAAEFSFEPIMPPVALGSGQSVNIPVSVTGVSTGDLSATLRITYAGQHHDVELSAEVLATTTVTIGNGAQSQAYPFSTNYAWHCSATLYTADQINAGGHIDMLAWDCASTSSISIPYRIWAKNTTETTMNTMNWLILRASMTLLKEGIYTPNTPGWQAFQLETPFAYTGENLIVAVETNYGPHLHNYDQKYRYTPGGFRHQHWSDYSPGYPSYGSVDQNLPNIMIHFSTGLQDDIGAFSISGSTTPALGEAANYTVSIRNNGSNPQSNYQVKLMGLNDTELAVVNGPPIDSLQTLDVVIPWTPTTPGPLTIYAKVQLHGDELAQNDRTGIMQVEVQPAGTQAVTIGAGNELAGYPIAFTPWSSIYQSLYLADELGFASGTINSLMLYSHFVHNVTNVPIKIYLGSTDRVDLSTGWIPTSQMALVFDGLTHYPKGENNILIHFQTPYVHTGGNLVVMFYRPTSSSFFGEGDRFRCQTLDINRARYYQCDSGSLDPFNPPAGTLTGQFPQTTFLYIPGLLTNDLAAFHITGDISPTMGTPYRYTIRLRNLGSAPQTAYAVKLMSAGGMELASVAGPPISSAQILDVVIPWTPTAAGPVTIYGKVELSGDEVAQNNQTSPLQVNVCPEGTQAITVGAGDQPARFPMLLEGDRFTYQALYREVELGFISGTITSLALYSNFEHQRNLPTRIYLGSTAREDMSAGYLPTSELTLVYDGLIHYRAGENTILIQFQTPYVHPGGNLVLMFSRVSEDAYHYSHLFKCQSGGRNRAFYAHTDFDLYPNSPYEAKFTDLYPKVTFLCNTDLIHNDLAAWDISGSLSPSVGVASLYTVRVRNMGVEAQANYTVSIMGPGDVVLASAAGPPIDGSQTLEVTIPWLPHTPGDYSIYGKIEMDGDVQPSNNRTPNLDLMVYPEGVLAVTVGDGSQDAKLPMDMERDASLFQALYYADEMEGFVGLITGIKLFNDFESDFTDIPVSIWMGTTTRNGFYSEFTPSTQLTPVFDGLVDFPSGQNAIDLTLDPPFMYLDGTNLVMLIYKPIGSAWTDDFFRCQTQGSNRSLNYSDWWDTIDPASPPSGYTSGQIPQTTFMLTPGEVGQVGGCLTDPSGQPIGNAELSINDGLFSTTTNAAGAYRFPQVLILPDTYTISITAYGFFDHTQRFDLMADQQLTINVTMQPQPQVSVSGTILANDALTGLSDALIKLDGYGSHIANTDGQGCFSIDVYANHSYDYEISAAGYVTHHGRIDVQDTDCVLDVIMLIEPTCAPLSVTAAVNDADDAVLVTWEPPDPETRTGMEDIGNKTGLDVVNKAPAQRPLSAARSRHLPGGFSCSEPGLSRSRPASEGSKAQLGYWVYRLPTNLEHYPGAWTLLNPEPVATLSFLDTGWETLPNGYYRWAVRTAYDGDITSEATFSNFLQKDAPCGTIFGKVTGTDDTAIAGATISNGTLSTTTNSTGAYALVVPVGAYSITASAPGFWDQTVENVEVTLDQYTHLSFVLVDTPIDDPQIPVLATSLSGNYPNPFNPETTISYSVKEPGRVKLEVYNIRGQLIRTLVDSDHATGHYKQVFNSKDNRGNPISSGVYLIRMSAPGYRKTAKMILMQ